MDHSESDDVVATRVRAESVEHNLTQCAPVCGAVWSSPSNINQSMESSCQSLRGEENILLGDWRLYRDQGAGEHTLLLEANKKFYIVKA